MLTSLVLTGVWLMVILLCVLGHFRKTALTLSGLLYVRYMMWRVWYTIPTDDMAGFVTGIILWGAELYGTIQFGFFAFQTWHGFHHTPVPEKSEHVPSVDLFVCVVREPIELLRQTLYGCLNQTGTSADIKVHVLDDGKREDVKRLAEKLGCGYHTRSNTPQHAKAGNINATLPKTHGELIAIFDVDHVPTRNFVKETIDYFHDPQVAMVQTSQHFYNPDIFQTRYTRKVQNEQELFFSVLQPGRNAHNSAFFAGSGGVVRRSALEDIGGFKTQTITEDIHTSMELHSRGWKSVHVNQPLSAGLMPETFHGYVKQRKRWAIGCMQVFFGDNPLFKRGLTWQQRIDYLGSMFYFMFGFPRMIAIVAPLTMLLFGVTPVTAQIWHLVIQFGAVYMAIMFTMHLSVKGMRNPFISDVYEVAMAPSLCMAALSICIPRKERVFEVTPKGEGQKEKTKLTPMFPLVVLTAALVTGLVFGALLIQTGSYHLGVPYAMIWASINLLMVLMALWTAVPSFYRRASYRHMIQDLREIPTTLNGQSVILKDLSVSGALLQVDGDHDFLVGQHVGVKLRSLSYHGNIVRLEKSLISIQFDETSEAYSERGLVNLIFGDSGVWETQRGLDKQVTYGKM